ncbi:MAG: acylneuraminate cytidylyltransferase family protein [Polyangiaceae bacterium]|nr:acylneuraminate cytidylyltransferase family protein [Polyangiaceae bacterium]
MRVLGLVPARGGSRGVPRKNLRLLGGRPLLAYTAEAALAAATLARVVLSTDDDEIAEVGRALGLAVPFLRPAELAADATPTLPVVAHALAALREGGERFDAVCLLQPTSPLRGPGEIDDCVALLERTGADCVMTVHAVPHAYHPDWVWLGEPAAALRLATGRSSPVPRRQELAPAWHRSGSVYVTQTRVVDGGSLYGDRVLGVPVPVDRSVNLDTLADFDRAEALLRADG